MLLPFTTVDHRIDSSLPLEERRSLRRSAPERLRFEPPGPSVRAPVPDPTPTPMRRSRLRLALGRALIAWGQRLAEPSTAR